MNGLNLGENAIERENAGRRGFASGVFILTLSTLSVKIIGLLFKIPMLSILGAEGMGYFNSAYEIYALLCVISTAGLPVALSMLVARARARGDAVAVNQVYKTAYRLFFVLGFAGSCFMLIFARGTAELIGNSEAYLSIAAIAPSLFFVCMSSAARGYCQGFENMLPTAISQLIEAVSKLVLGMIFAMLARGGGYGTPVVCAAAVSGITVGCLLSMLYLVPCVKRAGRAEGFERAKEAHKKDKILSTLVRIALPITLSSSILSLTRIIDMTLIMRRLVGVGESEANIIYGSYTTLALPLYSLIPALIAPIAPALVPQLSSLGELGDKAGEARATAHAMRLTALAALPASLGLSIYSKEILSLLFRGRDTEIALAAPMLSLLGASVLFSCMITTTNAVLQSSGHPSLPIISMSVGVAVKLVLSYWLMGLETVGMSGAPLGSLGCTVCVTLLNLIFIKARTAHSIELAASLFKPLLASLPSIALSLFAHRAVRLTLGDALSLAIAIFVAAAVYFALLMLLGGLKKEDLEILPFLRKRKNK